MESSGPDALLCLEIRWRIKLNVLNVLKEGAGMFAERMGK